MRRRSYSSAEANSSNSSSVANHLHKSIAKMKLDAMAKQESSSTDGRTNDSGFLPSISSGKSGSRSRRHSFNGMGSNSDSASLSMPRNSRSPSGLTTSFSVSSPTETSKRYRKKVDLDKKTTMQRRRKRLDEQSLSRKQQKEDTKEESNTNQHEDEVFIITSSNTTESQTSNNTASTQPIDETELKALQEREALMHDLSSWVKKFQTDSEDPSSNADETHDDSQGRPSLSVNVPRSMGLRNAPHTTGTPYANRSFEYEDSPLHDSHQDLFSQRADSSKPMQTLDRSSLGTPGIRNRRQSTAADILSPQIPNMTLSHGGLGFDDTDPANLLNKAMKDAWDSINRFDDILDQDILSTIDVSDLIDDFMASNLINFSLKLRNLFYKIEEVDDINARRTREERKILGKLLDLADEEERFKARKYLEEQKKRDGEGDYSTDGHTPTSNTPPPLSVEEVTERSQRRKQRRARSIWANEDRQAQLLEEQPHHQSTMTNIDFTYIDHMQKESTRLSKKCHHLRFMLEDAVSTMDREVENTRQETAAKVKASFHKITTEIGVQHDTKPLTTERVVYKQAEDTSLEDFASNMDAVFNSMNSDANMPPGMNKQVKNLMHLVMNDNKLQQEQKKLDKAQKKAQKKSDKKSKKKKNRESQNAHHQESDSPSGDAANSPNDANEAASSNTPEIESAETPRSHSMGSNMKETSAAHASQNNDAHLSSPSEFATKQAATTSTMSKDSNSVNSPVTSKFSIENLQPSSETDVGISRRVSNALTPRTDNMRIERWQDDDKRHLTTPPPRKTPRPPSTSSTAPTLPTKSNDSKLRRYSAPPPPERPAPNYEPTRIEEFDISEAPDKWQRRREQLVRERYENMKKILKCFYTIVYEGTMHGYFKTLWDDDEEGSEMKNGYGMRAGAALSSSHHFNPQYTGRGGFQYLMDTSARNVEASQDNSSPKKKIRVVSLQEMEESLRKTREDTSKASQQQSSARKRKPGKRSFIVPSPAAGTGHSRPDSLSISHKSKRDGTGNAPSVDMSRAFSEASANTSRTKISRDSGHRLIGRSRSSAGRSSRRRSSALQ